MKAGDLVTVASKQWSVDERPLGIVACCDPEGIPDTEVEVIWTHNWCGKSILLIQNLEVISESR